jgi:hypothetical protein
VVEKEIEKGTMRIRNREGEGEVKEESEGVLMIKRDGSINDQRSCLFDQKGESGDTKGEQGEGESG